MFCMLCAFLIFFGLVASGLIFCASSSYYYYYSSIPCIDCCVLLSYIKTKNKRPMFANVWVAYFLTSTTTHMPCDSPLQPLMIFESHLGPQLCNSCVFGWWQHASHQMNKNLKLVNRRTPAIWWYHCLVPSRIKK
jgi:hypothetical protein